MQFPGPVRAVVGLLANAADEAKHLPDRALELPMLAVSTALQVSMRAQQRYAQLAARGDEVLNRRPPTEEPPPWARFDEPVGPDDAAGVDEFSAADEPLAAEPPAAEPLADAPPVEPAAGPAAAPGSDGVGRARAKRAPAKRAADTARGKAVSKPRHTSPSRFDDAADE
jgi:hypothetical protein